MCSIKTDFIKKILLNLRRAITVYRLSTIFVAFQWKWKKNKLQIEAVVYRCFKSNGWIKKTHIRRDKKMGIEWTPKEAIPGLLTG